LIFVTVRGGVFFEAGTEFLNNIYTSFVVLGRLVVIVLATGPKVSGLKLGQDDAIVKGDKNP
jgi:hypothetical protein